MSSRTTVTVLAVLALCLSPAGRALSSAGPAAQQGCMARNVYYEARGEGATGMAAVGWVALNRASEGGGTPCGVVMQRSGGRCQFSWACARVARPDGDSWERAQAVAEAITDSPDPTGGATSFSVCGAAHDTSLRLTRRIGHHCFYRRPDAASTPGEGSFTLVESTDSAHGYTLVTGQQGDDPVARTRRLGRGVVETGEAVHLRYGHRHGGHR